MTMMMVDDDNDDYDNYSDVFVYLTYRQQPEHIIPQKAALTLALSC